MKKTISILFALCGMASSVYGGTLMDQSVFGYTKFEEGLSANVGTKKSSVTGTLGDNTYWHGMLRMGGTSAAHFSGVAMSSAPYGNTRTASTVTLMLDTSKLVRPSSGFSTIFTTSAASGLQWGLGVTSTGSLCMLWRASSSATLSNYVTLSSVLPSTGSVMLSMVTGKPDGVTEASRLYVGSSSVYFSNTGLKFGTDLTQLHVGGDMNNGFNMKGAIQQLYVHDKALSQSEVGALMAEMKLVPEPATATLGLLGLGCLAWRRRRCA